MSDYIEFDHKLKALHEKLAALNQYHKYNKLEFTFPDTGTYRRSLYKKHCNFFKAGSNYRFRMLSGGNGSGKSFSAAYEIAVHATGLYPDWWEGKKFKKLTSIWIVAESGALFRDSMQKILLGNPGEEFGTGLIPHSKHHPDGVGILDTSAFQGIPGAVGSILVKNVKGQVVAISIKTFDMHREKFQAANVGLVVFDEEPPEDVYEECIMRTRGTKTTESGIVMLAFTPLKGLTSVVLQYLPNGIFPRDGIVPGKSMYVERIDWDDAPHLTEEDKEQLLSVISPNLREARKSGIPALGSGRVYPLHEEDIIVRNLQIAPHWPRAYGLDFGWNCTAAVWVAQDPDTGIYYIYSEYYRGQQAPYVHANAIQAKGKWIPGGCDPRGDKSSERDGSKLIDEYTSLGLELTPGDNAIQSGVAKILNLLESGLLKVCYNCENWLSEFRVYRYDAKDPNKIARNQDDHLLDATRYVITVFDSIAKTAIEGMEEMEGYSEENRRPKGQENRDPITGY